MRLRARVAAASALTVICTSVLIGLTNQSARADEDDSPVLTESCDADKPLGQEGACDPADDLPPLEDLLAAIDESPAKQRFAGAYLDRSGTDVKQVVLFTGKTSADQDLLDSASGGSSDVVAEGATFTQVLLENTHDVLLNVLQLVDGTFSIGESTSDNRLEVAVSSQALANIVTSVLEALNLPSTILDLSVSEDAGIERTATDREVYPPHSGGLFLSLDDLNSSRWNGCTSGFSIKTSAGTHMGVTAGHCSDGYLAADIYIGNDYLSRSGQNSYWAATTSNSDALRYTVPSGHSWQPKILVGSGSYRWVTSPAYTPSTLQQGVNLCFQGITSDNNNCGNIVRRDQSSRDSRGRTTKHLYFINFTGKGGDSGGPMYHVNSNGTAKPAGIVVGGTSGYTGFSPISYVLSDMNASLYFH